MTIIDTILSRKEFQDDPPVLIDIGASGGIHPDWKQIAPYAVCIAFDPDDREMSNVTTTGGKFKNLHIFPTIVSDQTVGKTQFYLTKSPFCSSVLEPDHKALEDWAFSELFQVVRTAEFKTVTLQKVFDQLHIERIDWFKTDSQGIDLRLFKSLPPDVMDRVLAADFEPGLIDAYRGEDKLFSLLAFMEERDFWLSDLKICGSQRIRKEIMDANFTPFARKSFRYLLKTSPGWGEASFLSSMKQRQSISKRDYFLSWVISTIKKQHGFACEIATNGLDCCKEPLFAEMQEHSLSKIRSRMYSLPITYCKKIIDKLFAIAGVDVL